MAKLKYLISRGFHKPANLLGPTPPEWPKMSRKERIDFALDEFEPKSAEIAYYQGVGLMSGPPQNNGKSMAAFNLALQLTKGKFFRASVELSRVYVKEANFSMAYSVIIDAVETLHESIKSGNFSIEEIKEISNENRGRAKFQKKTMPHGLPNEHTKENIWIQSWKVSMCLSKMGDFRDAYNVLMIGVKHLENALQNYENSIIYLRQHLISEDKLIDSSTISYQT
jgi:hypothetical protein